MVSDMDELLEKGNVQVLEGEEPERFDPKTDVDITGLEPWKVLQALHRNTQAVGMGRMRDKEMSDAEAQAMIQETRRVGWKRSFDYVFGRPLKFMLVEKADGSQAWLHRIDLYDRDSRRRARDVIAELRKETDDGALR